MTIATTIVSATTKSANATKGKAKLLTTVVLDHRNDKDTASKSVNTLNKSVGAILHGSGSADDKQSAIAQAAEAAKAAAMASIDRQVNRAVQLSSVSRGTTGKGNIHCADVITEVFSGVSKSDAKANNTAALQSAGLL
jgi:hypothetical protein